MNSRIHTFLLILVNVVGAFAYRAGTATAQDGPSISVQPLPGLGFRQTKPTCLRQETDQCPLPPTPVGVSTKFQIDGITTPLELRLKRVAGRPTLEVIGDQFVLRHNGDELPLAAGSYALSPNFVDGTLDLVPADPSATITQRVRVWPTGQDSGTAGGHWIGLFDKGGLVEFSEGGIGVSLEFAIAPPK